MAGLLSVLAIIAGGAISFYCFWYLQFGVRDDRWWLIALGLFASFLLIASGVYGVGVWWLG